MISQVVSIGGVWGTAARTFNGLVQLIVAIWLIKSIKGAYPRLRHWRAAVAGVWLVLSASLLAAPFGLLPSEWTPWIVHGVLIVLGPTVALAQRAANGVAKQADCDLNAAIGEKDSWQ